MRILVSNRLVMMDPIFSTLAQGLVSLSSERAEVFCTTSDMILLRWSGASFSEEMFFMSNSILKLVDPQEEA